MTNMTEQPKVIMLPWAHQLPQDRWHELHPFDYWTIYSCPLCGWYRFHPLSYCQHCRGKLDRIGVLKSYYEEWKIGKIDSGL